MSGAGGSAASAHAKASRRVAAAFVGVQVAVLAALLIAIPGGSSWTLGSDVAVVAVAAQAVGALVIGVAAVGLGRGVTPMPLPNERTLLRTTGLYRWVRHPMYTGLILLTAGTAAPSGSPAAVGLVGILAVVLTAKARWEEGHLHRAFDGYAGYARRTGRFLPRLRLRAARAPYGRPPGGADATASHTQSK